MAILQTMQHFPKIGNGRFINSGGRLIISGDHFGIIWWSYKNKKKFFRWLTNISLHNFGN